MSQSKDSRGFILGVDPKVQSKELPGGQLITALALRSIDML